MNYCRFVVDPANLGAIPNASLGSLNQGVLWPTGIQATPGTPGVVKGVYCTDSIALGTTHCQNWHAAALAIGAAIGSCINTSPPLDIALHRTL